MDAVVSIVFGICLIMLLFAAFAELLEDLERSLSVQRQKIWEHSHLKEKGYKKRRKQLFAQIGVMAGLAILFLAAAIFCWTLLGRINRYESAGHDRFGEALFGGGALLLAALACSIRISVLGAKLRAIRSMYYGDNSR